MNVNMKIEYERFIIFDRSAKVRRNILSACKFYLHSKVSLPPCVHSKSVFSHFIEINERESGAL